MESQRERFLKVFKQEHQVVFDTVLELRDAVRDVNAEAAKKLVQTLDQVMGPHFRVEEEGLYPMLVQYLGRENVDHLLGEHRGAIQGMHQFKQSAGDREWLKAHGAEALKTLEAFCMHVASCDGLSIIVERFSEGEKRELDGHLDRVQAEPLPLTEWKPAAV